MSRYSFAPRIAALALVCLLSQGIAQAAPLLAGFWLVEGNHDTLTDDKGKLPPMTAEARKRYNAAVAARKLGKYTGDTLTKCLPHGLPRLLGAPYPIEVLEEKKQITFLHEVHHMPRLVYLGEKLPPIDDLDGNFMGLSVGNWNGDTLVIDSAGFNDITTLDKAGIPHSTEMVLQERMKLIDGGQRLENVVTVTDPQTFTKPWSYRLTFKRMPNDYWLKEFACTDKNPDA